MREDDIRGEISEATAKQLERTLADIEQEPTGRHVLLALHHPPFPPKGDIPPWTGTQGMRGAARPCRLSLVLALPWPLVVLGGARPVTAAACRQPPPRAQLLDVIKRHPSVQVVLTGCDARETRARSRFRTTYERPCGCTGIRTPSSQSNGKGATSTALLQRAISAYAREQQQLPRLPPLRRMLWDVCPSLLPHVAVAWRVDGDAQP
eukprot:scaffold316_cov351-Prasinococcus_capsulatus_cf.AAC.6